MVGGGKFIKFKRSEDFDFSSKENYLRCVRVYFEFLSNEIFNEFTEMFEFRMKIL